MRLYGHGIRRRSAPMLGADPDRLRMAWSLTFSLPGAPIILYGDEIGLGEDLARDGRMAVRIPMDSDAVAEQRRDRDSLLEWMRRLLWCRRDAPEIGWGTATLIESAHSSLFAQRVDWQGSTVVTVHNLGEEDAEAELELGDDVAGIDDLVELHEHNVRKGRLHVKLGRYGYLWLRLRFAH